MIFPFGVSFTPEFFPGVNGTPLRAESTPVRIYVFDQQPTPAAARDGTGAIATITAWSVDASSPYRCTYSVSAIEDPEPDSAVVEREYWEALNYLLSSGGETQTTIRAFTLSRVAAHDSEPDVDDDDLTKLFPNFGKYLTATNLDDFILQAAEELKLKLVTKFKVPWERISNLRDCRIALKYMAASIAAASQIVQKDDRHDLRAAQWAKKAQEYLTAATLKIDTDGDGKADSTVSASPGYIFSLR